MALQTNLESVMQEAEQAPAMSREMSIEWENDS